MIHVFVFDEDNKFYDQWTEIPTTFNQDYTIPIPLKFGTYSIIAWGGNTFADYSYSIANFEKNKTTLHDVILKLNRPANDTIIDKPHHLFFAYLTNAQAITCNETFVLPMMQHTNDINVTVKNLPKPANQYSLTIVDNNGSETFDNNIVNDTFLYYKNIFGNVSNSDKIASVRTMRLAQNREPKIVLKDLSTGEILYQDNLVKLLLELKDLGAPIDFENIHEYNLTLIFQGSLSVAINIGQWTIVRENVEL